MKFMLFVEGHTEHKALGSFLKRWLDPRLSSPVGIASVNLKGNRGFAREIKSRVEFYLNHDKKGNIVRAIGLLDLYKGASFPADKTTIQEKHNWGVRHFENLVANPGFRMFFAVHEVEAWILSSPDILPRSVRDRYASNPKSPEHVNFKEPPSKLLNRLYLSALGKGYKKTTYGVNLFAKLNPENAYGECPHLRGMLDEMLTMAKAAGL